MTVHAGATRVVVVLLALLAILLAALTTGAPAAVAAAEGEAPAEGGEELTIEQLRQQASDRAQEFFPEEYQEPSFFQWISIPTMLIGLLMVVALVGAYLWWQPRFAAERRAKSKQRR